MTTGRDPHGTIDREDLLEILGTTAENSFTKRSPLPGVRQNLLPPSAKGPGPQYSEGIDATPVRVQPLQQQQQQKFSPLPGVGSNRVDNPGPPIRDGGDQHQQYSGATFVGHPPSAPVIGRIDDGVPIEPVPDNLALDGGPNHVIMDSDVGGNKPNGNRGDIPILKATSTFLADEKSGDMERVGDVPTARRIAKRHLASVRSKRPGSASPAMSQMNKLAELAIAKQDHLYALVEEASENAAALEKLTARLRSLRNANESLEASNETLGRSAKAYGPQVGGGFVI